MIHAASSLGIATGVFFIFVLSGIFNAEETSEKIFLVVLSVLLGLCITLLILINL